MVLVLVGERPGAARAARPVTARELEREQRRDEQQEHEEHDERVAVQACTSTSTSASTSIALLSAQWPHAHVHVQVRVRRLRNAQKCRRRRGKKEEEKEQEEMGTEDVPGARLGRRGLHDGARVAAVLAAARRQHRAARTRVRIAHRLVAAIRALRLEEYSTRVFANNCSSHQNQRGSGSGSQLFQFGPNASNTHNKQIYNLVLVRKEDKAHASFMGMSGESLWWLQLYMACVGRSGMQKLICMGVWSLSREPVK